MNIIGIDPGKQGGAVLMRDDGMLLLWQPPPIEIPMILGFLSHALPKGKCRAVIEHVHAFPSKMGGAKANFASGLGYGAWQAALTSFQIGYEIVPAVTWQKIITKRKGWDRARLKKELIAEAIRRWPEIGNLQKGAHSGIADAALIAEFCRTRGKS